MKRKYLFFGIAVLLIAVLFTMAGCKDPVTGEELFPGSVELRNEYANNSINSLSLYKGPGASGAPEWEKTGLDIAHNTSQTIADVPPGTWTILINGGTNYLDNVVISPGLTTNITRQNNGDPWAGVPH